MRQDLDGALRGGRPAVLTDRREELEMLPARELETSDDAPPGVVDSLEEAWFSQSRAVPRAMSSRPPRAPSIPPPALETLEDDTADEWFACPDSET